MATLIGEYIQEARISYAGTTDDSEVALDVITVGIGDDGPVLVDAGLHVPEPTASIYWPDWIPVATKSMLPLRAPTPLRKPYAVRTASVTFGPTIA